MKELFRRLRAWPFLSFEIGLASLLIGVLSLATPLYVMQVLRRYVSSGIDGTLVTLGVGTIAAVVMEFAFRQMRLRMARGINLRPDAELSGRVFATITDAKISALARVPQAQQREMINHLNTVQQAYGPMNLAAMFNVPLTLLYLGVVFLLQPAIALIVLFFIGIMVLMSMASKYVQKKPNNELQQASARNKNMAQSALDVDASVRAFNASRHLKDLWG